MKLSKEQVMVAMGMQERGTSVRKVASRLGVTEGALRYRLKPAAEPSAVDGRARQATALDGLEDVVEAIQELLEPAPRPCQAQEIYGQVAICV